MIVMLILGTLYKKRTKSSLLEVDHVSPSEGGDIHRL